jgi:hypothetical protein
MKNEWVANIKTGLTRNTYEMSVVRKSFPHGIESYGWNVWDKKIILFGQNHNKLSENYTIEPTKDQFEKGIKITEMFCKMLNELDKHKKFSGKGGAKL